jgi:ribosomal protein S18 acetylase RimI-like enzyme
MRASRTHTDIQIYSATLDDIPTLCKLLAILFSQETEFQPHHAKQEAALKILLNNPDLGDIIVARSDIRTIGMVSLLYTVSTALGGRVAILEDMLVHPDFRNQAIGSHLLNHAVSVAREKACRRITLLTDKDNLAAQQFYQRHGFKASSMLPMRLLLEVDEV